MGGGRQRNVDLRNFSSRAPPGILHAKGHLNSPSRRYLDAGVGKRGVRESVTEGKQRLLFFGVIPFVSHLQTFIVGNIKRCIIPSEAGESSRRWRRAGQERRQWRLLKNRQVRQVSLAPRKCNGQLRRRVDIAKQNIGQRLRAANA